MSLLDIHNKIIDESLLAYYVAMDEKGGFAWLFVERELNTVEVNENDKLINSEYNLDKGDKLGRWIKSVFNAQSSEYQNLLNGLRDGIDLMYEETKAYYAEKDIYLTSTENYSYERMAKGAVTALKGDLDIYLGEVSFTDKVIEPAKKAYINHVQNASTKDAMLKDMKHRIDDRFYNFSVTASTTIMNQFSRRIIDIFISHSNLEQRFVQYAGANDSKTRDFCKDRLEGSPDGIYHIEEVKEWPQFYAPWDGMIEPTDRGSIFVNAGGYNCRHGFIYLQAKDVPQSVKDRAERAGFIVY